VVINPLLFTNFARLSLRKTKTDKRDALTIAQFLLAHRDGLSQMGYSQSSQELKDLARERESLAGMIAGLKNDIRRILQMTFPVLEHRCKIFTETMLRFLSKFPSARIIRTAKSREVFKSLIHERGMRKRVFITTEEMIEMVKASVASDSVAKELILSEKIETLLYLESGAYLGQQPSPAPAGRLKSIKPPFLPALKRSSLERDLLKVGILNFISQCYISKRNH
jgi:hypothetical protein